MMKKKPQRMCVSCRQRRDKKDLMRVVLDSEGNISYDPSGKLPGRGSYLCKKRECIMMELKAHRLSKGLRHNVDEEELKRVAEAVLAECARDEASEDSTVKGE